MPLKLVSTLYLQLKRQFQYFPLFLSAFVLAGYQSHAQIWGGHYLQKITVPNDTIQHSNEAVVLVAGNDSVFYFSQKSAPRQKIAEFHLFFSQNNTIREVKVPFVKEATPDKILFADPDNKTLYFTCSVKKDDIYFSKFIAGKWQKPLPFNALNSAWRESGMCISPDKKKVIFASARNGKNLDLYSIHYQENGFWTIPQVVSSVLVSEFDEDFPSFSPDGKTLYFASKGFNSTGNFDLFYSSYDETKDTWSVPVPLGAEVNTTFNEIAPTINSRGLLSLFSSDRSGKPGDYDLYRSIKADKLAFTVQVNSEDSSLQIGHLQVTLKPLEDNTAHDLTENSARPGTYSDTLFLNRWYLLTIKDGKETLITEKVRLTSGSEKSRDYYIALAKLKEPYLHYKGKKIPLLTKYIFRYEKEELLPVKNNGKALERVSELLGQLRIYKVEIQYPAKQKQVLTKRLEHLKNYLISNGASPEDLVISGQPVGSTEELTLKMEFKYQIH